MAKTIIVSGFAGSGKSTLADSLGKALKLKVVHASALLKEMRESGISALESKNVKKIEDWWETAEAKKFMKERKENTALDIALDKKLKEIADAGNVVLDSWTMPYLYKGKAFKIWLEASPETRAKRVSERDSLDYKEVLAKVNRRDKETKGLYETLYNFRMGENLGIFDFVFKTNDLPKQEVFAKALQKVKEWIGK